MKTIENFDVILSDCKQLFDKKRKDYGDAWRILRSSSLTDQILIKASRIRSIQEKGDQKISDDITSEFIGIINYSIMAILQIKNQQKINILNSYEVEVKAVRSLLENKNHDYDEIWRKMRVSSIVDIILMKIQRIKSIEDNNGRTIVSEGLIANFQDIINYAVFCLILMQGDIDLELDELVDRTNSNDRPVNKDGVEMPKFRCHKDVWALKIKEIIPEKNNYFRIFTEYAEWGDFLVEAEYINKHKPYAGGYYVVYKDGYKSFSPADAFESGYIKIK